MKLFPVFSFLHSTSRIIMNASKQPNSKPTPRGFTLIEVVVAIGIVATVFIAFMGMLPLGMDTMREAGAITTQARISQQLIGELQLTDWRKKGETSNSVLEDINASTVRYFDEYGNESNSQTDSIYQAMVEISEGEKSAPNLPGSKPNDYLRQVTVKVAYAPPGMDMDFSDSIESPKYKRYVAMIADMKKRKSETNN